MYFNCCKIFVQKVNLNIYVNKYLIYFVIMLNMLKEFFELFSNVRRMVQFFEFLGICENCLVKDFV